MYVVGLGLSICITHLINANENHSDTLLAMTVTGCLYFKSPLTFTPVKELGSHTQQGQELPATKHYTEHEGWNGPGAVANSLD